MTPQLREEPAHEGQKDSDGGMGTVCAKALGHAKLGTTAAVPQWASLVLSSL